MKAQDFASVYHCPCSLNRCYFFFVLWCLSLQTSGFPLVCQVVLPQHSGCQDVAVPPQIRVWGILFCCYLLSADRCTFACGDLAGILCLHSRKDYTSGSAVLCQLCLPWTLLQEAFPLKHFWRVYNLINCHLWNARARLFPCRFQIVHFSPTLSLHYKTRSSCFRFYFWSLFLAQKSSWITLLNTEEGRVNGLDYAPNAR